MPRSTKSQSITRCTAIDLRAHLRIAGSTSDAQLCNPPDDGLAVMGNNQTHPPQQTSGRIFPRPVSSESIAAPSWVRNCSIASFIGGGRSAHQPPRFRLIAGIMLPPLGPIERHYATSGVTTNNETGVENRDCQKNTKAGYAIVYRREVRLERHGSIRTPGLSRPCGSSAFFVARSASANSGGRCLSYHGR